MSLRENIPDAMIFGGLATGFLVFMSYIMKNQIDQIFAEENAFAILLPTSIFLCGLVFKMESFMQSSKENQITQEQIDKQNKQDSESILKKYNSMPDLEKKN